MLKQFPSLVGIKDLQKCEKSSKSPVRTEIGLYRALEKKKDPGQGFFKVLEFRLYRAFFDQFSGHTSKKKNLSPDRSFYILRFFSGPGQFLYNY